MGVVPIVLDNPAERCLVTDHETGFVVGTPREFGDTVSWLAEHPLERQKIGLRAADSVRNRFAVAKMVDAFNCHYSSVRMKNKTIFSFAAMFGSTPADWFLASQRHPEFFFADSELLEIDKYTLPGLMERSKGSVFHYQASFPDDLRLQFWAGRLNSYQST